MQSTKLEFYFNFTATRLKFYKTYDLGIEAKLLLLLPEN